MIWPAMESCVAKRHKISDYMHQRIDLLHFWSRFFNGPNPASFYVYLRLFNTSNLIQIKIDKSIDGVLGNWTRGGRTEDADESTELLWHPYDVTQLRFRLSKIKLQKLKFVLDNKKQHPAGGSEQQHGTADTIPINLFASSRSVAGSW